MSRQQTALPHRWPRSVSRTMNRHGLDMERLRRGARHRPDRAFRHNAPGFCSVCEVWIEPALDVHMSNVHLEMAQLWRCPVEWCAVWKGSVRACQKHLSEKHGGSSLFGLKNVAKFPPHGLFPATSGRRLFNPMFRVLLWKSVSSLRLDVDWCTVTPPPPLPQGLLPMMGGMRLEWLLTAILTKISHL